MGKPIKHFLNTLIPEHHRWKFELFKQWDCIIGRMKNKVFIEKIDNDILYLRVIHPVWAQELMLLTPLLKEKINACLPETKINTIRLRHQPLAKAQTNSPSSRMQTESPQLHETKLSAQEQRMLAQLHNQELQSVMTAYLIRCKNVKRSRNEKK